MATKATTRTIRCAYCGETRTVPSARGPAPSYCSPAHRQAAYRQRRAAERGVARTSRMTLHDEIRAIRAALDAAAQAKTWREGRQALADVSTILDQQEGR